MAFAVIVIRGTINSKKGVADTLAMLNLHKKQHCTVIPDTPAYRGMLQKVKDYVTWGEVSPKFLARLILEKGRLEGNVPVTEDYIKENTKYTSALAFANAVVKGEEKLTGIPGMKPVFRLPPPKQGFKSVKRPFADKGDLGYRGKEIEKLLEKML